MGKLSLWSSYKVTWDFQTTLFGSMPASEDVLDKWVKQQITRGRLRPREQESIEELRDRAVKEAAELLPTEDELKEERTLVFKRVPWSAVLDGVGSWQWVEKNGDERVISLWGGNIRSHLKECARALSSLVMAKPEGVKSLSVRFTNGAYVAENWIPVVRNGLPPEVSSYSFFTIGDTAEEFSVHAVDFRTGARINSLKQCEGILPPCQVMFTLRIINKAGKKIEPLVTEEELDLIMQYGSIHGYGQERSRGYGRYVFEFEKIGMSSVES